MTTLVGVCIRYEERRQAERLGEDGIRQTSAKEGHVDRGGPESNRDDPPHDRGVRMSSGVYEASILPRRSTSTSGACRATCAWNFAKISSVR